MYLNSLQDRSPQPRQMPGHCTKATKRQWGLDAARISYLKDSVKGRFEGAIPVCREPAKENAQRLYIVKINALQHSSPCKTPDVA